MRIKRVVSTLAVATAVFFGGLGMVSAAHVMSSVDPCQLRSMAFDQCQPLDTSQVSVAPVPAWCFYDSATQVWESEVTDDGLCSGHLDPNYHEGDDTKAGA